MIYSRTLFISIIVIFFFFLFVSIFIPVLFISILLLFIAFLRNYLAWIFQLRSWALSTKINEWKLNKTCVNALKKMKNASINSSRITNLQVFVLLWLWCWTYLIEINAILLRAVHLLLFLVCGGALIRSSKDRIIPCLLFSNIAKEGIERVIWILFCQGYCLLSFPNHLEWSIDGIELIIALWRSVTYSVVLLVWPIHLLKVYLHF